MADIMSLHFNGCEKIQFGRYKAHEVLYIDAFDHELQDIIAQLSLLLKGESMHLKLQYATIIYNKDDNTMTFMDDINTIMFQYNVDKHKPMFTKWYNEIQKRKPTSKSTKENIYKKNCTKLTIEVMTNDVNLEYSHKQHNEHDTMGYYHNFQIGVPSIDAWRTVGLCAVPSNDYLWSAVRDLSLFLQFDRDMEIKLPLAMLKHIGNTFYIEYTNHDSDTLHVRQFTYIPQLYKEVFERYYTSLCHCFRTAVLWHKRWLPIKYIEHKINTIVSKKSTITLEEALTYF